MLPRKGDRDKLSLKWRTSVHEKILLRPWRVFPGSTVDKNPCAKAGDMDLILGLERSHMLWRNWAWAPQLTKRVGPRAELRNERPPRWATRPSHEGQSLSTATRGKPSRDTATAKKKKRELGNANSKAAKDVAIHIANKRLVRINEDSLLIYKGKQENFFFF